MADPFLSLSSLRPLSRVSRNALKRLRVDAGEKKERGTKSRDREFLSVDRRWEKKARAATRMHRVAPKEQHSRD